MLFRSPISRALCGCETAQLAQALRDADQPTGAAMPLLVAVTARCRSAVQCSALLHRGLDAVVVKPMRLATLRVLLEHVWS